MAADLVAALDEDCLRDAVVAVDRGQVLLRDGALVDRAREAVPGSGGGRVGDEAAAGHDRDAGTEHRDVIHDVRGEEDGAVLGEFREVGVEAEVLRQVAQLPPDPAGVGDDVLAVEVDGAGGRLEQPGHDPGSGSQAWRRPPSVRGLRVSIRFGGSAPGTT
ncbi:hypothetical protein [Candidatus Palauibacter sp.]|uniref:hypothetical protein n=1 Tax=Candidatus Palauibacter sp. TaxID=3101350 RepID=UPI003B010776